MLGLGIDEFDEFNDEQITIEEIPVIAEDTFLIIHGRNFTLSYNEKSNFILTATI